MIKKLQRILLATVLLLTFTFTDSKMGYALTDEPPTHPHVYRIPATSLDANSPDPATNTILTGITVLYNAVANMYMAARPNVQMPGENTSIAIQMTR